MNYFIVRDDDDLFVFLKKLFRNINFFSRKHKIFCVPVCFWHVLRESFVCLVVVVGIILKD